MIDVVVYLSSLQKILPGRKVDTLTAFAEGAKKLGAKVLVESSYTFRPAKLAVILGWPSPILSTPNIKFRADIVKQQLASGNHVMSIDANCFKFIDTESKYLRYSINSVEYNIGQYANKNSDDSKWKQLENDLRLKIKDWRFSGDYNLLLVQRDGGWGMKGLNPLEWAASKIREIRSLSQELIVLRPHPGKVSDLTPLKSKNIMLSDSINRPLLADIAGAKRSFVFNSSSGVASIISGVPLWTDDASAVCWDVSNKNFSNFENPLFYDRSQWLYDLAACHWTDEESSQGLVYKKFLPYLI